MPMTQTFTTQLNDVVRYLYDETSKTENAEIEQKLTEDVHLLDFYLDGLSLKSDMDKIRLEPSDRTINAILAFSRSYEPVH